MDGMDGIREPAAKRARSNSHSCSNSNSNSNSNLNLNLTANSPVSVGGEISNEGGMGGLLAAHYGSGETEIGDADLPEEKKVESSSPVQVFPLLGNYENDDEENDDVVDVDEMNEDVKQEDQPPEPGNSTKPPEQPQASSPPKDLPPHLQKSNLQKSNLKNGPNIECQKDAQSPAEKEDSEESGSLSDSKKSGKKSESGVESVSLTQEELEAMLPDELKVPCEGEVDPEVQATIHQFLDIQRTKNLIFNDKIKTTKGFRNPCFLTKMAAHFTIDEFGTELRPDIFNPTHINKDDTIHGLRMERTRKPAQTSPITNTSPNVPVSSGKNAPPPVVAHAIAQGVKAVQEKFTNMAAGKGRVSKWDSGR